MSKQQQNNEESTSEETPTENAVAAASEKTPRAARMTEVQRELAAKMHGAYFAQSERPFRLIVNAHFAHCERDAASLVSSLLALGILLPSGRPL